MEALQILKILKIPKLLKMLKNKGENTSPPPPAPLTTAVAAVRAARRDPPPRPAHCTTAAPIPALHPRVSHSAPRGGPGPAQCGGRRGAHVSACDVGQQPGCASGARCSRSAGISENWGCVLA